MKFHWCFWRARQWKAIQWRDLKMWIEKRHREQKQSRWFIVHVQNFICWVPTLLCTLNLSLIDHSGNSWDLKRLFEVLTSMDQSQQLFLPWTLAQWCCPWWWLSVHLCWQCLLLTRHADSFSQSASPCSMQLISTVSARFYLTDNLWCHSAEGSKIHLVSINCLPSTLVIFHILPT